MKAQTNGVLMSQVFRSLTDRRLKTESLSLQYFFCRSASRLGRPAAYSGERASALSQAYCGGCFRNFSRKGPKSPCCGIWPFSNKIIELKKAGGVQPSGVR